MVERIVAAARDVLVERGYTDASTNRIAAAAGISPGSLYQYFPDKDAVLTEVLDRYLDGMEARVSRAFLDVLGGGPPGGHGGGPPGGDGGGPPHRDGGGPPGGHGGGPPDRSTAPMVRATLEALLDAFAEQPDLLRVLVEQLPRTPGGRRVAFARRIDDLVATVLLARGASGTDGARAAAWTIVRTVEQLTTGYVLECPDFPREVVVEESTALVAGYLDERWSGGRVASVGPS